jgi:hypothetical protein
MLFPTLLGFTLSTGSSLGGITPSYQPQVLCTNADGTYYAAHGACPPSPGVPGPLTIAGVTSAFYYSRKLRNRIKSQ